MRKIPRKNGRYVRRKKPRVLSDWKIFAELSTWGPLNVISFAQAGDFFISPTAA